jgi:hypothetical protein
MNMPPTACAHSGCSQYGVAGGYCADHQDQTSKKYHDSYAVKRTKPFFKEYKSARWKKLREARLRGNPICQVIEGGIQCRSAATVAHHIVDPKVGGESALWNASNIVCICAHHHPGGQEGERSQDRRNFADTILFGGTRIVHPKYESKQTAQGMSLSCKLAGLPE